MRIGQGLTVLIAGAMLAACGGGGDSGGSPEAAGGIGAPSPVAASAGTAPTPDAPTAIAPNPLTEVAEVDSTEAGEVATPTDALEAATADLPPDPLAALLATDPAVPKAVAPAPVGRAIPGRYIVTLRPPVVTDPAADPGAEPPADTVTKSLGRAGGGTVHQRYTKALRGYAAELDADTLERLRTDPEVLSIEEDQLVELAATAPVQTQTAVAWGLDRIDQRTLPLTGAYRYAGTGADVTVFVVDTGIRATHSEFLTGLGAATYRVRGDLGYTSITDGRGTTDCHGHGTHVAGTVGGLTWGVAKQVTLVPIRVLGCTGSGALSGVIAGLDFVARSPRRPAVANLSLGGSASTAVDAAVANATAAGITVVAAAGNANTDACRHSPARAPSAITVGATTHTDSRAAFSNWGRCVDLFAPGNAITSAGISSDIAAAGMSGTSMAAPHVAGAAALLLAQEPALAPAQVAERLRTRATPNRLSAIGTGSPNLLLHTQPEEDPPPSTISVRSLAGLGAKTGSGTWTATATISVRTSGGVPVSRAIVNGGFDAGGARVSCLTNAQGVCSVRTSALSRVRQASVVFTVSKVDAKGLPYDATANTVGSVTVQRP
jgi:subtilisin family serine protease